MVDIKKDTIGILLAHLGTPITPKRGDVKRYLCQMLSDRRLIGEVSWYWPFLLHGIILPFRSKQSAIRYQKIWTDEGSPMFAIATRQAKALEALIHSQGCNNIIVDIGMRHGTPSISDTLLNFQNQQCQQVVILPMMPQYCSSVTGSIFDEVTRVLSTFKNIPQLSFIKSYHNHPAYITALANAIRSNWEICGPPEKLLMSFHGIPVSMLQYEPYENQCRHTAWLLAEKLKLEPNSWVLTFQSKVGKKRWLEPDSIATLEIMAEKGIKHTQVVCPGFSVDCLETLEEIAIEAKNLFLASGGNQFHYIPALNETQEHIHAIYEIIQETLGKLCSKPTHSFPLKPHRLYATSLPADWAIRMRPQRFLRQKKSGRIWKSLD